MMAIVWRNRIADILRAKGLSISDLQRHAGMSYTSAHRVATSPIISDDTKAGTLKRIAAALEVEITELFEEVEE
jgi:transcriptional regulator with XRE-family HTH domain